ncbi:hypothetical protein EM595_1118 [Duffyella gerundensis]|uniref:Uncharacterized protein n=1 Tax=Duffyella gerundensis TaxID=1619313 RepID=A0A0U5KYI9_9GAMM|nr:hypothetical protein EM595_1118 [Duffyella gerundensis]
METFKCIQKKPWFIFGIFRRFLIIVFNSHSARLFSKALMHISNELTVIRL